jgi:hypothetical protein
MPGKPWTVREVSMLRRYARDGLSFRRAQVAFSLDGYERTVYALQHKARAQGVRYHGEPGRASRVMVCPRGHKIEEVGRHGSECAACSRARNRAYRERKRQKQLIRLGAGVIGLAQGSTGACDNPIIGVPRRCA